jgi:hypothetical protein
VTPKEKKMDEKVIIFIDTETMTEIELQESEEL